MLKALLTPFLLMTAASSGLTLPNFERLSLDHLLTEKCGYHQLALKKASLINLTLKELKSEEGGDTANRLTGLGN